MKNIPAFPDWIQNGMTLRDYFAAHAMSAMLEQMFKAKPSDEAINSAIAGCYKIADAMLKARGQA